MNDDFPAVRFLSEPINLPPPKFAPDHPLEPFPPTFWNRLMCRALGHHLTLTSFHHHLLVATYLCLRCSRVVSSSLSTGTITDQPEDPVITQH